MPGSNRRKGGNGLQRENLEEEGDGNNLYHDCGSCITFVETHQTIYTKKEMNFTIGKLYLNKPESFLKKIIKKIVRLRKLKIWDVKG